MPGIPDVMCESVFFFSSRVCSPLEGRDGGVPQDRKASPTRDGAVGRDADDRLLADAERSQVPLTARGVEVLRGVRGVLPQEAHGEGGQQHCTKKFIDDAPFFKCLGPETGGGRLQSREGRRKQYL